VGLERLEAIDMGKCTPGTPLPEGFIEQFRLESGGGSAKVPTSIACDFRSVNPAVIRNPGDPPTYKYDHPGQPWGGRLQSSQTANSYIKEHAITWASNDSIDPNSSEGAQLEREGRGRCTGNGDFVRNLKFGDIITIWAKARFSEWTSTVQEVKIDVYWAI
jgi:hypothetical protein